MIGNHAIGNFAMGGGITTTTGSVTLNSTRIDGNDATGPNARGGGIYSAVGTTTLQSVTVVSNRAVGSGANGGVIFPGERHGHTHHQLRGRQPARQLRQPQHGDRLFLGSPCRLRNAPPRSRSPVPIAVVGGAASVDRAELA